MSIVIYDFCVRILCETTLPKGYTDCLVERWYQEILLEPYTKQQYVDGVQQQRVTTIGQFESREEYLIHNL